MSIVLGPLDRAPDPNRGNSGGDLVCPGKQTTVVEVKSYSAPGYMLSVVLGIQAVAPKCDHVKIACAHEDVFVLPMVRACISWGIGNASFEAECDYLNGTQVSVAAENIRVDARYLQFTRPWIKGDGLQVQPTYRVSAGFAYSSVGRNSNSARLTELAQIETPGESCIISIPDFAISMTILPVDASSVRADVFGFGRLYKTQYNVTGPLSNVGQNNVENALPLFNGAKFVEVTNTNQAGPAFAFVVFGLAL